VQLGLILALGLFLLNAGYGFCRSFQPLGEYEFVSATLSGQRPVSGDASGNRFRETWLAAVPVPFPADYLRGIDEQKLDFERPQWSFLRGEWRQTGWWYYYLYGLAIKEPVGVWVLLILAIVGRLTKSGTRLGLADLVLLAPAAAVMLLVSSQTGMNHHVRYVFPCLPFLYIWIGGCARENQPFRSQKLLNLVAACWITFGSAWAYPHSLAYFNELVGGSAGGIHQLNNSNLDWGQDLLYLKRWREARWHIGRLNLAYFGRIDPTIAGVDYALPVGHNGAPPHGVYAISATFLQGRPYYAFDGTGTRRWVEHRELSPWFANRMPYARIGSIWIYQLEAGER
jgi:hypothetical protein